MDKIVHDPVQEDGHRTLTGDLARLHAYSKTVLRDAISGN